MTNAKINFYFVFIHHFLAIKKRLKTKIKGKNTYLDTQEYSPKIALSVRV